MSDKCIELKHGPPWGFRISTSLPVRITRVNPGSGAAERGVREGDIIKEINAEPLAHLSNAEVQQLLSTTGPSITLTLITPSNQQKRREDNNSPSKRKTPKTKEGSARPPPPTLTNEQQSSSSPFWTPPSASNSSRQRKFKPINFNSPSSVSDDEERINREDSPSLPRYQSPTVTLLQKARQGELPKGAHYLQPSAISVPSPDDSYERILRERESLKGFYSEPESKSRPKKPFLPRKSETQRGIRFSPGRIEDYDPSKPACSPSLVQRPPLKLGSKDLGYESDSTLIIRRREGLDATPPPPPLSPSQQRQVYLEIQKGGEVPLQGLRKPPPTKQSQGRMSRSERGWSRSPGREISRSHSDLQPGRKSRPSAIPVRTVTPNLANQKLKSQPELISPRKVLQTTHQISLKVEVERDRGSTSSVAAPSSRRSKSTTAVKKPAEKPPSAIPKTTAKKVTKVVKIDVEGKGSRNKSPSRHASCLSPSPKRAVQPSTISSAIQNRNDSKNEVKREATKEKKRGVNHPPALTPYLRQTQRVSRSIFLIESSYPIPRPTFTSMLREGLKKSPRFLQLHTFYRSLERLGELERTTCPFLFSYEQNLDFETWWEARRRRKEEAEIEILSSILKEAEDRKEFFYRPASATRMIRWSRENDSGLRTKQWTIEEIKNSFNRRRTPSPSSSDIYKTGWRGISVRELGLNLEVASLSKSQFQFYEPTARHGWLRRAFSMTSTLSPSERENIRSQLGDLLRKSGGGKEEEKKNRGVFGGVVRGRMGHTLSSDPYRPSSLSPSAGWDGSLSESTKKAISRSLSAEIQEKGKTGILVQRKSPKEAVSKRAERQHQNVTKNNLVPPISESRCRSVSPGGMRFDEAGRPGSNSRLNILTKLASIVLSRDPGFQRVLRRGVISDDYRHLRSGRQEVGRLKEYFETTPSLSSSQPNLRSHPSSPESYANWKRSRRPIYDPSSTPNICQPTLSPHSPLSSLQNHGPSSIGNWEIDPSLHRPVSRYVPPPPPYTNHYGTYPRGRRGGGVKYAESEVNIHYKAPVRLEEKKWIGEDEIRKTQERAMREFYQQQRQRKQLQEIKDIQSRRHMDYFTPSQKSPIPMNRFDGEEERTEAKLLARALFNFLPKNPRELRLRKGDLVTIRRKLDSNWLEGELHGTVGIFPASYVQVLSSPPRIREDGGGLVEGLARVKFNFRGASPAEMSITQGETIKLTRRVDPNWYEGTSGGRKGIFPATYVTVLREPGSGYYQHQQAGFKSPKNLSWEEGIGDDLRIDTRNQPALYRAIYNYFPAHKDELELRDNDVVEVLENCDDGWCVGTSTRTGLFGTFPGNYITRLN